jgi:hypothetical protein
MRHSISATTFLSYCPPSFRRSGRKPLYPGDRNEAVFEPLRFFVVVRTTGQKPGRFAGGLWASAQRNGPGYARQSLRERNGKTLAANLILRFPRRMSAPNNTGSKLSACPTRQERERPSAVSSLELGKEGVTPSVASSPVPRAAADTVPVSVPSGFSGVVAPRLFEVRP